MIYEINYATNDFFSAQKYHVKCAREKGKFDRIISYSPNKLDDDFKICNSRILNQKKGGGYWIWKSHIINLTLNKIKNGDYLFYCDTGAVIRHPISKLIAIMENNHDEIMVFEVYGHSEEEWTKRDIFQYFQYDNLKCRKSNQIMATFILMKKTEKTVDIFRQYEKACTSGTLITDDENKCGLPNHFGFCENRHDQSILSVLLKKNEIKPYRDPSQFGLYQTIKYYQKNMNSESDYEVYKKSKYPCMMFLLHRDRKVESGLKFWIWILLKYKQIIEAFIIYIFNKKKKL